MNYSLDLKNGLYTAKAKKLRYSLILALVSFVTIVADVLLMVNSSRKYAINASVCIVLTTLCLFYIILYFSVINPGFDSDLRFFDGALDCQNEPKKYLLMNLEDKQKQHNGREYYLLNVKEISNLEEIEKVLFIETKDIPFKQGEKVHIKTFGSVVLEIN